MGVQVGDVQVSAVVDTAAQVTIISDKVYNSLKHKPPKIRDVKLQTAGRELSMAAFVAGPVKLKVGHQWYQVNMFVAPIEQQMLLGFDLLRDPGKSVLDMSKAELYFDGMRISLDVHSSDSHVVSKVTVSKRQVIPPHSVARVQCRLHSPLHSYIVEPVNQKKFLAPRVLHEGTNTPVLCLVNRSDSYRLVRRGTEIGRAFAISEVVRNECDVETSLPSKVFETSGAVGPIPPHLQEVYDTSCGSLDEGQRIQLAQLLIEFQDVFIKGELDLGDFTDKERDIDTKEAKLVKQGMRRKPTCFAGEEEAQPQGMPKAGGVQDATSKWASAPVLIRKHDGSVRYCIDYRTLNKVTVKDVYPLPLVDDCMDTFAGSVWFSKLDANSAFFQLNIREGFGLCGAPATFARAMDLVLRGLTWKTVLAFLDDIIVLGRNFEDHLSNLREALSRFRRHKLKLKPKECIFFQQRSRVFRP
ncbi:uncharacterized protein LOC132734568 [Ruditapes philippinarum]|uniref:uncharacterized protein LOC132734568 n=1 Tax=Ruditapes philippinarum TaxID=129788 RepID=UPI00295B8F63|nr:uncharacterized protein LOC132734568 [Ruditapes philippinarum]